MKKNIKISKNDLNKIALKCHELLSRDETNSEKLTFISHYLLDRIGEYFGPAILSDPDEISIRFIELLDLIVFEIIENSSGDDKIREYVIEDLYKRLTKYIDVYNDKEIYKQNLCNRVISKDDTMIIRHCKMSEYIPELLVEFYEQPELQYFILRVLLVFEADELPHFYNQIIKENYSLDIKLLALIGLVRSGFNEWDRIKSSVDEFKVLIDYLKTFDVKNIEKNKVPDEIYTLLFLINYIEIFTLELLGQSKSEWIFSVLSATTLVKQDSSYFNKMCRDISNIIIYFDIKSLKSFMKNDEKVLSFMSLIDYLPREFFDRISMKISFLGDDLVLAIKKMIASGEINSENRNSNVLNLLFMSTNNSL